MGALCHSDGSSVAILCSNSSLAGYHRQKSEFWRGVDDRRMARHGRSPQRMAPKRRLTCRGKAFSRSTRRPRSGVASFRPLGRYRIADTGGDNEDKPPGCHLHRRSRFGPTAAQVLRKRRTTEREVSTWPFIPPRARRGRQRYIPPRPSPHDRRVGCQSRSCRSGLTIGRRREPRGPRPSERSLRRVGEDAPFSEILQSGTQQIDVDLEKSSYLDIGASRLQRQTIEKLTNRRIHVVNRPFRI